MNNIGTILDYYNNNEDFKEYVDKYCNQYKYTVEEALTHALVICVYKHYKHGQNK